MEEVGPVTLGLPFALPFYRRCLFKDHVLPGRASFVDDDGSRAWSSYLRPNQSSFHAINRSLLAVTKPSEWMPNSNLSMSNTPATGQ